MQFGDRDLYKSISDKAAGYFESCAYHHVFMDGNKRTSVAIATRFLFLNGWELFASNEEVERFTLEAVTRKFDLKIIARWLKQHSKKIK